MVQIIKAVTLSLILGTATTEANNLDFNNNQKIRKVGNRERIQSVEKMIEVFYGKELYLYIPAIKNRTSSFKLPEDISIMVRGIFNSVGKSVQVISYLDPNNLPNKKVSIINGAITTFELVEISSEDGIQVADDIKAGGELSSVSMQDNLSKKVTKLGLTFSPSDANTGLFIPRTSTSNIIDLQEISNSDRPQYAIFGVSLDLEDRETISDGIHSSLRELAEINSIEVLGKLAYFPYWLVTKTESDQDLVAYLSKNFLRDTLKDKLKKISYLLGLKNKNIEITSFINSTLRDAIINYKQDKGLPPNDIISRKLYMSLLGI